MGNLTWNRLEKALLMSLIPRHRKGKLTWKALAELMQVEMTRRGISRRVYTTAKVKEAYRVHGGNRKKLFALWGEDGVKAREYLDSIDSTGNSPETAGLGTDVMDLNATVPEVNGNPAVQEVDSELNGREGLEKMEISFLLI